VQVLTNSTARVMSETFSTAYQIMDDLSGNLIALKRSFDAGGVLKMVFVSTKLLQQKAGRLGS
jgi:hypothetical protein